MFTGVLSPLQRNTLRAAVNVDISMCRAISFSHHVKVWDTLPITILLGFSISTFMVWMNTLYSPSFFTKPPLSCCLAGWVYNFNSSKFSWVPLPAMSDSFYYSPSGSFFSCPRSLLQRFLPHCYIVVFLVISSYSCWTSALFHYFCSSLSSPGTLRHCFTSSYHCKCATRSAVFYCIHGDPRIIVPY